MKKVLVIFALLAVSGCAHSNSHHKGYHDRVFVLDEPEECDKENPCN